MPLALCTMRFAFLPLITVFRFHLLLITDNRSLITRLPSLFFWHSLITDNRLLVFPSLLLTSSAFHLLLITDNCSLFTVFSPTPYSLLLTSYFLLPLPCALLLLPSILLLITDN